MSTSSNTPEILELSSHPTLEELVVKPAKRGELDKIFVDGFQASKLYAMIPQLEDEFPGRQGDVGEWLSINKPQWKVARDKHLASLAATVGTPMPKAAAIRAATKDDGTPESAASDGTDAKIAFLNLKKERLAKEVEVLEMKIVEKNMELADLDEELGRLQISKEKKAPSVKLKFQEKSMQNEFVVCADIVFQEVFDRYKKTRTDVQAPDRLVFKVDGHEIQPTDTPESFQGGMDTGCIIDVVLEKGVRDEDATLPPSCFLFSYCSCPESDLRECGHLGCKNHVHRWCARLEGLYVANTSDVYCCLEHKPE